MHSKDKTSRERERGTKRTKRKGRNKSNNRNYFNESRHRGKIERKSIFLGQI